MRGQVVFVAPEVVGQGGRGDGGDGDFVEEVGGCAGPSRGRLQKLGDGVDDWRGGSLVHGVEDGWFAFGEGGDGPLGGVGAASGRR